MGLDEPDNASACRGQVRQPRHQHRLPSSPGHTQLDANTVAGNRLFIVEADVTTE
ncbi:hypothetical protein ACMDCT_09715 [Halomonadaceae bacterium KBTZ08]